MSKFKPKTTDKPTLARGTQVIVTNCGQTYTTYEEAAEVLGIRRTTWKKNYTPSNGSKHTVWNTVLHPSYGEELLAIVDPLTGDSYIIAIQGVEAVKVDTLSPVQAVRKLVDEAENLHEELLSVTAERDQYKALVDRMRELLNC